MNSELSILSLVLQASVLVQLVMAGLLAISIGSWTIIFRKGFTIRAARRATDAFEDDFWNDRDLGALYQQVRHDSADRGAMARIFEAGMSEFLKTRQQKPGDVQAARPCWLRRESTRVRRTTDFKAWVSWRTFWSDTWQAI